jgi:hypothetical protein
LKTQYLTYIHFPYLFLQLSYSSSWICFCTYVGCAFRIQSCCLPKFSFWGCAMPRLGNSTEGKYCIFEEVSGKAILVSSQAENKIYYFLLMT